MDISIAECKLFSVCPSDGMNPLFLLVLESAENHKAEVT